MYIYMYVRMYVYMFVKKKKGLPENHFRGIMGIIDQRVIVKSEGVLVHSFLSIF